MAANNRIDVPKLTSQIGNSALFETLKDMLTRTAAYVKEVAAPRTINGPSLLGLSSEGEGYVEEVTLGYGLSLSAGVLSVSAPLTLRTVAYTSGSGNFTTGATTTKIYASAAAGGGGGAGRRTGGSYGVGGGGGGGACVIEREYTVTPNTVYAYAVGAGGNAGANHATTPTNGSTGGSTTLGALLTLAGGVGGNSVTGTGGGGGGAAGGPGGQNGFSGESFIATYETAPKGGRGGITAFGGFGCGGDAADYDNSGATAGKAGYLLIKWYE